MDTLQQYKEKSRIQVREEALLYRLTHSNSYYERRKGDSSFNLTNTGCCIVCLESEPMVLEQHHIAGRNNSDATVTLCANCHKIVTTRQTSWPKEWTNRDNFDLVRLAFIFVGLVEIARQILGSKTGGKEKAILCTYLLACMIFEKEHPDNTDIQLFRPLGFFVLLFLLCSGQNKRRQA